MSIRKSLWKIERCLLYKHFRVSDCLKFFLFLFKLHNQELPFLMGVPGSNLQTKCILLQLWKKLEDLVNLVAMPLPHTVHTDGIRSTEEEPWYKGKFFSHLLLASTRLIPYDPQGRRAPASVHIYQLLILQQTGPSHVHSIIWLFASLIWSPSMPIFSHLSPWDTPPYESHLPSLYVPV